jgi:nucleoid-associated protein YgaU
MMCADGSMMEVLEERRYESQKQQVEGSFELSGPGMVLLLWDNSFSWVNPKQLSYTVELHQETPPETPAEKAELALTARVERQRRLIRAETNVSAINATIRTQEASAEELRWQIKELEEKLEKTEAAKVAAVKARERMDEEVDTLAWELSGASTRRNRSTTVECEWLIGSACSAELEMPGRIGARPDSRQPGQSQPHSVVRNLRVA